MRTLTLLFALVLPGISAVAALAVGSRAPKLVAEPGWTVRQGDCLKLVGTGVPRIDIGDLQVHWLGKAMWDLFWERDETISGSGSEESGSQCIYLPVPIDAGPGKHPVSMTWFNGGGKTYRLTGIITITPRAFGKQHLKVTAKQEATYTYPGVEREYKLIRGALGKFTPDRHWEGQFVVPVKGRVSTTFGLTRYRNGVKQSSHKGLDIAAPQGREVHAANSGTVALTATDFRLHGQTVVIDHGLGVCTLYLHLSKILVKPGQQVKKDDIIAKVGSTGVATGPHLHYALYVAGVAVDPAWWEAAAR